MFVALLLLIISSATASAQPIGPDPTPVLRIDGGGHTGTITQLELDHRGQRIVTVSVDRTLRVWRSDSLALERTVRMPIGPGYEGSLYALAVSPVTDVAAVAGWTGFTWESSGSVYLVDLNTGSFIQRIDGLDEIAANMRFSPDGRSLYVALSNGRGVRAIDIESGKIVAEDRDFAGTAIGIEFLDRDRLVVAAHDGKLRFYRSDLSLLSVHDVSAGGLPTAVRASADGARVAIGFMDRAAVEIRSANDGASLPGPDTDCMVDQRNTPRVFWAPSGRRLFAYGTYDGPGEAPLYAWSHRDGAFGPCERLQTGGRNLGDMHPLDDQTLAIATTEPAVGLLDIGSGQSRLSGRALADFRGAARHLALSRSGDRVVFPTSRRGDLMAFDLTRKRLTRTSDEAIDSTLLAHPGLGDAVAIDGLLPATRLVVDGQALELADAETVHDIVALPDATTVTASQFGLVRHRDTAIVQRVASVDPVQALAVAGDGALLVALVGDGTLRWHRTDTLELILSLYVDVTDTDEEPDWIAWTPEGFYLSSNFGDRLVGWHLNADIDTPADFYPVRQYETLLYRPDIVLDTFFSRGAPDPTTRSVQAPPDIRQVSPGHLSAELLEVGSGVATLRMQADARHLPMNDVAVFVNDIPVLPLEQRRIGAGENREMVRTLTVPLNDSRNRIRIEVSNGKSLAVAQQIVQHPNGAPPERVGDLYVVSIGVSQFDDADGSTLRNLNFADYDATEFARAMRDRSGSLYRNVEVVELSDYTDDRLPTAANIRTALAGLERAGPHDTVIVFLASHGVADDRGNYFFVPRDARLGDVETLLDGGQPGDSLVGWADFLDAFRNASGKRLMIVDTCAAQGISGPQDVHSLAKRSAAASFGLLAASGDAEESQENVRLGHGLFTWALLEAIREPDDSDGVRTLQELYTDLAPRVNDRRDPQRPQTPQLVVVPSLASMPIVPAL